MNLSNGASIDLQSKALQVEPWKGGEAELL